MPHVKFSELGDGAVVDPTDKLVGLDGGTQTKTYPISALAVFFTAAATAAMAASLAAKLDDTQAGTFGLTLLGSANVAAAKTAMGYVKSDIGLGNVDNTTDANKPVSTAQQTALDAKVDDTQAGVFGLTLFGSANLAAAKVSLAYTKADLSLGNVDNTSDAAKPVSSATQTALDAKLDDTQASATGLSLLGAANLAGVKTFLAYTATDLGLGNVNNTSDAAKPVSTAQQTALDAKLDDTQAGVFGLALLGTANLAAAKTALAYTKSDVGLGNVDNTSDANKPVSTAQLTALDLKLDDSQAGTFGLTLLGSANLAAAKTSLAYVKADVGLGNVDNTADTAKPVSTAQQTALNLKADVANPVHSGQIYFQQVTPTTKGAAATLTIAEILVSIVQYTGAAANLTLPTGTLTDAGILAGALAVDRAFEWAVINTGSGIATLVAATGHTIIGGATVAIGATARFWTRKTAANTFVTYRTG